MVCSIWSVDWCQGCHSASSIVLYNLFLFDQKKKYGKQTETPNQETPETIFFFFSWRIAKIDSSWSSLITLVESVAFYSDVKNWFYWGEVHHMLYGEAQIYACDNLVFTQIIYFLSLLISLCDMTQLIKYIRLKLGPRESVSILPSHPGIEFYYPSNF